jgi:hypothetical protein
MSKVTRKSVVVVGGGAAGANISRLLSSKINASTTSLTLVTARPFILHNPACIRLTTTAEGKLEDTVLIPYDSLLVNGNGTIKVGRVTAIEPGKESSGSVVLSTGERIHYDILVLAPGAEWQGPLAFPDDRAAVLEHIKSWRRKIENADGIILAGGGAVGCGTLFCLTVRLLGLSLIICFRIRWRDQGCVPSQEGHHCSLRLPACQFDLPQQVSQAGRERPHLPRGQHRV